MCPVIGPSNCQGNLQMTSSTRISIASRLLQRFNFRFPTLVLILGGLTLIDWLIPDAIPFIDEIGLALLTVLFGMWKARRPANHRDDAQ
jgi:hypothetical protein